MGTRHSSGGTTACLLVLQVELLSFGPPGASARASADRSSALDPDERTATQVLNVLVGDRQGSSGFSFRAWISAVFLPCKLYFTKSDILVGRFFPKFGGGKGFSLNFKL